MLIAAVLGAVLFSVSASPASACCVAMTEAERIANSDVIFEGTALDGPTESGIQRFRVTRYLKGSGPEIAGVSTGVRVGSGLMMVTSISLRVDAESEWRIFGQRQPDGTVTTNGCLGSARLPLPPLSQNPDVRKAGPGLTLLNRRAPLTKPSKSMRPRAAKKIKATPKRTARRARGAVKRR